MRNRPCRAVINYDHRFDTVQSPLYTPIQIFLKKQSRIRLLKIILSLQVPRKIIKRGHVAIDKKNTVTA